MYRVKQLFGGSLTLRDYDGQVAEAMVMRRALNKMTTNWKHHHVISERMFYFLAYIQ